MPIGSPIGTSGAIFRALHASARGPLARMQIVQAQQHHVVSQHTHHGDITRAHGLDSCFLQATCLSRYLLGKVQVSRMPWTAAAAMTTRCHGACARRCCLTPLPRCAATGPSCMALSRQLLPCMIARSHSRGELYVSWPCASPVNPPGGVACRSSHLVVVLGCCRYQLQSVPSPYTDALKGMPAGFIAAAAPRGGEAPMSLLQAMHAC